MAPVEYLIDTSGGPNLVTKTSLYSTCMDGVKLQCILEIRSANRQVLRSEGVGMLDVTIGDLCIRVLFRVGIHAATDILFGNSCIDRYTRGIFAVE